MPVLLPDVEDPPWPALPDCPVDPPLFPAAPVFPAAELDVPPEPPELQPEDPRKSKARPIPAACAKAARRVRPPAELTVENRWDRCACMSFTPLRLIGESLLHGEGGATAESGWKICVHVSAAQKVPSQKMV